MCIRVPCVNQYYLALLNLMTAEKGFSIAQVSSRLPSSMINVSPEVTAVIDDMERAKETCDHLAHLYTPHGFNLTYISVDTYALKYKSLLK